VELSAEAPSMMVELSPGVPPEGLPSGDDPSTMVRSSGGTGGCY
jgi:hypothetical protein